MLFRNRRDAGRRLAEELSVYRGRRPVVVGLPRGGVPVAFEVARALLGDLDVVLVRKIGAPGRPELAMGAVAEDGVVLLDDDLVARLGVDRAAVDRLVHRAQHELAEQEAMVRRARSPARVKGRTVVVVDDGLATGATMRAAIAVLQRRGARRIVVGAPVGAGDTVRALRAVTDDVVCAATPSEFTNVGQWYSEFAPVTDEEVIELLTRSNDESSGRIPTVSVPTEYAVQVDVDDLQLPGQLAVVAGATGAVVFAHGSGSSRLSPRNQLVAAALQQAGLSTLLFDLLTPSEAGDRSAVFDIPRLGTRLLGATDWLSRRPGFGSTPVGWFGASTGAGAALWAAPDAGPRLRTVVSRGGRPDLAGSRLTEVAVPTLLIVGAADTRVLELNRGAEQALAGPVRLEIVPGATHLFEEPGAMEQVIDLARDWLVELLVPEAASSTSREPQHPARRAR
ncbi:MAG: phosphoribosyltransferase [Actinobacteria bacterium]|nr:phosphoribosyltransferase [Actinomycetota bacterium]